jgi:type I restriction enzyme S subunit
MTNLPPGWSFAPISQVSRSCEQYTPADDETFEYVDIGSVERRSKKIGQTRKLVGKDASSRARRKIRKNDVLVSMTRPNLNAVALVPDELDGQIASTGFDVLRARGVDPRWIFYAVRSRKFIERMSGLAKGALYPAVRSKQVREFEIPIAPYAEQVRIVERLDTLFLRIDSCRERLERTTTAARLLRQSILSAAVSGRLNQNLDSNNYENIDGLSLVDLINSKHEAAGGHKIGNAAPPSDDVHDLSIEMFPPGWGLVTLRDIVEPGRPITYGILKPGPSVDEGVNYIRVADYPNDQIEPNFVRKTTVAIDEEFKRSRLCTGDILISIRGTVGRAVLIPAEFNGSNITQDSARISVQSSVNNSYILWYLRSPIAQERLRKATKGVAVRGVNIGDLRALQVPLPSRSEQDEIVRRVESLFRSIERIENGSANALNRLDKLGPVVLAKAFQGKLFEQNPNDEPASNLLFRLSQEALQENMLELVNSTTTYDRSVAANRSRKSNNLLKPKMNLLSNSAEESSKFSGLEQILISSGSMDARDLWIASGLSIDEFYSQLNSEIRTGALKISDADSTMIELTNEKKGGSDAN